MVGTYTNIQNGFLDLRGKLHACDEWQHDYAAVSEFGKTLKQLEILGYQHLSGGHWFESLKFPNQAQINTIFDWCQDNDKPLPSWIQSKMASSEEKNPVFNLDLVEIFCNFGDVEKNNSLPMNVAVINEVKRSRVWQYVTDPEMSFVVISAWRSSDSLEENKLADESLKQDLISYGKGGFVPLFGYYTYLSTGEQHKEPSYLVPNMDAETGKILGKKYDQESVIIKNASMFALISTELNSFGQVIIQFDVSTHNALSFDVDKATECFSKLMFGKDRGKEWKFNALRESCGNANFMSMAYATEEERFNVRWKPVLENLNDSEYSYDKDDLAESMGAFMLVRKRLMCKDCAIDFYAKNRISEVQKSDVHCGICGTRKHNPVYVCFPHKGFKEIY